MTVAVVGSGPAAEAVLAALDDVDVRVEAAAIDGIADADLAVVVGIVGSDGFEAANRVATTAGVPWIAVEIGGVGGRPVDSVDAAVSGFAPNSGCYACLRTRVEANADGEPSGEPSAGRSDVRLAGAVAGRHAVGSLTGATFAGTVIEVPYVRRRFLPAPNCPVCGGARDQAPDRDDWRDVDLDDAIARAERAIDGRVGVVRTVGEQESFPAPYYLALGTDTTGFSDVAAPDKAAGVATDWDEAYMKALGEALERYSAGVYRDRDFTVAPAAAVENPVSPEVFVRPDGYPTLGDEAIPWVPGERLSTGERAHLPAEFVQFPPEEARFKPAITTGLGLGNSSVEALLSGLYEVVERDATMLAWYSTFEPLGLTVDDEGYATLARRVRAEGLSVTPLLVTQDVDVPVVAVAVHRDGDWPRFALGSAASLDPDAAARSALAEAVQNWMELRSMGPDRAAGAGGAIGRYANFPREVRDLVDVDGSVPTEQVGPDGSPSGVDELETVLDRLTAASLDAYAARVTPRDVDALGFEAVRVLVPAAQPLFTDEPHFGDRARTVPRDLGFAPRLDRPFHPYP